MPRTEKNEEKDAAAWAMLKEQIDMRGCCKFGMK